MRPHLEQLETLTQQQERQNEQIELLRFQAQEIETTAPEPGEDEALELERRRLRNTQTLIQAVGGCVEAGANIEFGAAHRKRGGPK